MGKDYRGITTILTAPKKALPALRKAYHTCSDGKEKLRYAHVLGMLYDDTGAETLMTAISQATWDKGWNFRGMGQFGASTSPLDNLIIALGRTKDKKGITVIVAKLKQLTPRSEFSHCRAVAIALEYLKDPKAAEPLVALLKKNGVSGHAFLEINDVYERSPISITDNSTRNHSLRELLLARALFRCGDHDGVLPLVGLSCQVLRALFRCGDHDGVAEKILEGYSRDMRGLYAAHAKAILAEK